jgi:chromosome segregation ATPase
VELDELRKMPLPKLRERAKEITDLQGVVGMKKEELIEAIAKAEGISYQASQKDVATIRSIKKQIRSLRNQEEEVRSSSRDRSQIDRLRGKIKRLKRQTRKLAREASRQKAAQPTPAPETAPVPTPAASA